jgi:8-oxo-dGTP diphosphatase
MKKQTTGVYLIKDDKMLFLVRKKRNDAFHKQGMFLPIGGHVELGEGLVDAAIREVKEESGITVRSVDLKGIVYIRSQNTGEYDMIMSVFTSSDFTEEPVTGSEGSFTWVSIHDLKQANLYEGDIIFLELMQKHQFFVVELLYKGFDLVGHTVIKTI